MPNKQATTLRPFAAKCEDNKLDWETLALRRKQLLAVGEYKVGY